MATSPFVLPPLPAPLITPTGDIVSTELTNGVSVASVADTRVKLELDTPSVGTNSSRNFSGKFKDPEGLEIAFKNIIVLQIEIDASSLNNADTVTLILYRTGSRRTPRDVIARYSGTSQISGMWKSIFSDQRIEYFPAARDNTIYGTITNASGNLRSTTFHLIITAHKLD